jgi:hypothetical protein
MEYTICYGTPQQVAAEVNLLLSDKWLPGGVLISYGQGLVCQPMILESWNKKKPEKKAKT